MKLKSLIFPVQVPFKCRKTLCTWPSRWRALDGANHLEQVGYSFSMTTRVRPVQSCLVDAPEGYEVEVISGA